MKNIIIVAAIGAAAYYWYSQSSANVGVYFADGTPKTLLFTAVQCGSSCVEARRFLSQRVENVEEYDVLQSDIGSELYDTYGGTGRVPYIVMGKQRITGSDQGTLVSSLAAEFGLDKVNKRERRALQRNFDANGDARVVMYATAWCGYCDQARAYFLDNDIDFIELDIEKDPAAKRDYDVLRGAGTPLLYNGYARMAGFSKRSVKSGLDL